MTANNYVIILVLYYVIIGYGIFGIYIRHSVLYLIAENMIVIYNEHQENIF